MGFSEWLNDDYYTLLKVTQISTPREINKAYRNEAKHCHPDVFPLYSIECYQAERKFKQILQARNTLLDPQKRSEYDDKRLIWQDFYLTSMINKFNFKM